jgi:anti-sigma B factor antagonist
MSLIPPENRDRLIPDLTITERPVGDVLILDLTGKMKKFMGGKVVLREKIANLLTNGKKHILLNFKEVEMIDSHSLGELVGCLTTVTGQDGKLKLLNPGNRLQDLLEITKLQSVFEIYTDETEAVKSFESAS